MAGPPARQRIVVPFTGQVIGEGFNSETAERLTPGLTVARVGEDPVAPGQTADFKFQMLTSQASLERSLNIGVEVDARYALFSGGAKFDFAESSAVNSTSTYILASSIVTNALRSGSGFTPNVTADRLIKANDRDGFKKAFGDRFTQALHTGGEFHALVRVTSSDTQHQRRIAASLHAELNGLTAGVSFKGSLETAQKDSSSHTEVNIQVHQTGGVGDQVKIPGTEADRIREHMNRFAAAAHSSAAAYRAELLTYDTLALPFPPESELEDRRRVLEDCLARRQRYWSVISDLNYAQSEDAPLIFDNLPSPEELVALQNTFRRILNDLMSHARAVSTGAIPPTFFVAEGEPPLPRFKRRTSGSFATWWARVKDKDPNLLQDELFLITRIADEARGLLTVPLEEASPPTVERAADMITELDVSFSEIESFPRLRSLAVLPKMIDAPLRELTAFGTRLEDLAGLETFSRLESAELVDSLIRDIGAIASAAGLGFLFLIKNNVADLSPLRALTRLQHLLLAGNQIRSLEPLRGLQDLNLLSIARVDRSDGSFLDNPIVDARALAALPRLTNPLTSAGKLRVKITEFDQGEETSKGGVATRIGDTHRFRFTSDEGDIEDEMILLALWELSDLNLLPAPVVVSGVRFRAAEQEGVAATRPDDPSASLPARQLAEIFQEESFTKDGGPGERFVQAAVGRLPELFLEVQTA